MDDYRKEVELVITPPGLEYTKRSGRLAVIGVEERQEPVETLQEGSISRPMTDEPSVFFVVGTAVRSLYWHS